MNFLVVDDNRLLNRFLTSYLRGKGHGAPSLTDSSKVESWLELNPCDGLILDIGMPKIDGLTLITQVRAKHPDLPDVGPRSGASLAGNRAHVDLHPYSTVWMTS